MTGCRAQPPRPNPLPASGRRRPRRSRLAGWARLHLILARAWRRRPAARRAPGDAVAAAAPTAPAPCGAEAGPAHAYTPGGGWSPRAEGPGGAAS